MCLHKFCLLKCLYTESGKNRPLATFATVLAILSYVRLKIISIEVGRVSSGHINILQNYAISDVKTLRF